MLSPPSPQITTTRVVVRPNDMDADRNVSNSVYFDYFYQARLEHLRRLGIYDPENPQYANLFALVENTCRYLAPAYLWARQNASSVWISTYTKNLQRQLEQETARLVPDPADRRRQIAVRKGRENYVCLLNMQEVFGRLTAGNPRTMLLAALIARWARYSRDGDMVGGLFGLLTE